MEDCNNEHEHNGHTIRGFVAGALLGALAGAGVMLLLAPQSGLATQAQIRQTGLALHDQAVGSMEDAMDQARATSQGITAKVHEQADKFQLQADKMQQRGQHALDVHKEHWVPVVEAGKTPANGS